MTKINKTLKKLKWKLKNEIRITKADVKSKKMEEKCHRKCGNFFLSQNQKNWRRKKIISPSIYTTIAVN